MAKHKSWAIKVDGTGDPYRVVEAVNLDMAQSIVFSDALIRGQEDKPFREATVTMANGIKHYFARESAERIERWVLARAQLQIS